jgi:hypothetical protein
MEVGELNFLLIVKSNSCQGIPGKLLLKISFKRVIYT